MKLTDYRRELQEVVSRFHLVDDYDLLIAFEKNDQLNVWDEGFKGIYDKINQDLKESVKDLERMETISHFLKGAES